MIDKTTKEIIKSKFDEWRKGEAQGYKEILGNKYSSKQDKEVARARLNELYPAIGEVNPLSFSKFIDDFDDLSK